MNMMTGLPFQVAHTTADTLESIALALEKRGDQKLIGMQGIETREMKALFASPANPNPIEVAQILIDTGYVLDCRIDGTIFGAIAEELAQLGYGHLSSIGEVVGALDIDITDYESAREHIHLIGCWCLGEVVDARIVAERIRALKQ